MQRQITRVFEPKDIQNNGFFWQRNFGDATSSNWVEFEQRFLSDYRADIEAFGQESVRYFCSVLKRDIFHGADVITLEMYDKFVGSYIGDDTDLFFAKVKQYVSASFALREVLNMDSTVRMTTIRHLCEY